DLRDRIRGDGPANQRRYHGIARSHLEALYFRLRKADRRQTKGVLIDGAETPDSDVESQWQKRIGARCRRRAVTRFANNRRLTKRQDARVAHRAWSVHDVVHDEN